jgi:Bromodomain extra-terminal - transcription regulation
MHTLSVLTELEMTYEQRKQFFENLKILVKSEYEEIFRILKKNKEEYTENSNGIFFDVMAVSEITFAQFQEYMHFCLENRKAEEGRTKELASLSEETNKYLVDGYSSE